jgi:SOUL heme-binding protein
MRRSQTMRMPWRGTLSTCVALLVTATGVAQSVAEEKPVAEPSGKKPWMFSEASLPVGFPQPGPINEVVVKDYPAYRLAKVTSSGKENGMFMQLFRHIERNEIAMTAPVEMSWHAEDGRLAKNPESMAFLYAAPTIGQAGGDPKDPRVVVDDIQPIKVVSIALRGSYDASTFERGFKQLQMWLADHPEWVTEGGPRTMAYNSPFVPGFAKVSEVQIAIRRADAGK